MNDIYRQMDSRKKSRHGLLYEELRNDIAGTITELRHGFEILCSNSGTGNMDFASFASEKIHEVFARKYKDASKEEIERAMREALIYMPFEDFDLLSHIRDPKDRERIKTWKQRRNNEWTRFISHYVASTANTSIQDA